MKILIICLLDGYILLSSYFTIKSINLTNFTIFHFFHIFQESKQIWSKIDMTQVYNQLVQEMDALNTFLALISKTEGRDKFLRLIQYATLHSVEHQTKGSAFKVYEQMRMTRKLLRFLRTLEYTTKIRQEVPELKKTLNNLPLLLRSITSILQNLFTFLFFLSDHRVCLSELGVISKQARVLHYPRSMKFYFLQNLMGVLNNIIQMAIKIHSSKDSEDIKKVVQAIKVYSFDLIRCLFDCLVALYYLKNNLPAGKIGILGVITSIMGIMQSIEKM